MTVFKETFCSFLFLPIKRDPIINSSSTSLQWIIGACKFLFHCHVHAATSFLSFYRIRIIIFLAVFMYNKHNLFLIYSVPFLKTLQSNERMYIFQCRVQVHVLHSLINICVYISFFILSYSPTIYIESIRMKVFMCSVIHKTERLFTIHPHPMLSFVLQ